MAATEKNGLEYFEAWKVEISYTAQTLDNGKQKSVPRYDKLKRERDCVKITQEQADALNDVLYGGNTFATMYFRPEGYDAWIASQVEKDFSDDTDDFDIN
jgi:hypothetical protein